MTNLDVRFSISGKYWYCSDPKVTVKSKYKKDVLEEVLDYCAYHGSKTKRFSVNVFTRLGHLYETIFIGE